MQDGLILVPGNRRLFTVIEEDDFQYLHSKVRHGFYMYLLEDGDFQYPRDSSYKGIACHLSFQYLRTKGTVTHVVENPAENQTISTGQLALWLKRRTPDKELGALTESGRPHTVDPDGIRLVWHDCLSSCIKLTIRHKHALAATIC
jgi:hypothetical protein